MRGIFITLEGPEGAGKSSQAKRLAAALRRAGRRVVTVRDPGATRLGLQLRRMLLHRHALKLSSMTEAMLFIAGRIQLVDERIRPALAQGAVVICDRFHDSTVSYQGFGGGADVAWLDQMGRHAIGGLMPDLTIVLDVPPSVGFARLRRSRDRMESKHAAFYRRVRQGFLTLARCEPRRIRVIDAAQSPSAVAAAILRGVRPLLPTRHASRS